MNNFKKSYNKLLAANLALNGPKALFYTFGLADCRYLEYSATLDYIKKLTPDENILDIGCGHSILPSIVGKNISSILLDYNEEAISWQKAKGLKLNFPCDGIHASGDNLPFKDNAFNAVISISAIEHFKDNGDVEAIKEIKRILVPNGICVLTIPLSTQAVEINDWKDGIPGIYHSLFGDKLLLKILKLFNVDRDRYYFMKRYTLKSALDTFVEKSGFKLEEYITFGGAPFTKYIHDNLIPQSVVTAFEYFSAWGIRYSDSDKYSGGLVLKLRKN